MLIGREPDAEPMAGLAEWQFKAGGWLQVNEDRKLAGRSSLILVETFDERLKQLKQAGIQPRLVSRGEKVCGPSMSFARFRSHTSLFAWKMIRSRPRSTSRLNPIKVRRGH
jgi:hypothetical protein